MAYREKKIKPPQLEIVLEGVSRVVIYEKVNVSVTEIVDSRYGNKMRKNMLLLPRDSFIFMSGVR